ncbi:MAG: zinc metallopeptidase [Clostridia bacterium]|nr:zinc metallopeptidase [Clostridia bacterium]
MFYFDSYYLILVLPAIVISLIAQAKVSSTYKKYSQVMSREAKTSTEVARAILDANGLYAVKVEAVSGTLSDHYDPRANVIRLSDSVRSDVSVASIGVAAHEVGHAIQHAQGYAPIKVRNAILPVANIGSHLSIPLIIAGIILSVEPLVTVGILAFAAVLLFQLVTLPVEFNASTRALKTLEDRGILYGDELIGAKKVLSAAAMTYVAAALTSLMQLIRLILISRDRD